ncbi:hypothetical protein C2857_000617 [Epichloe festucae Fl1]|uniref:Cell wall galactomannoprotein n=1 Tax=Epichloe festucae (strain Fl1) TaxID=877507 RepID=A0A7U3SMV6_EPIFF|nr:hypothetical protein C2857_000617 [Epichloe festucae Fl1]
MQLPRLLLLVVALPVMALAGPVPVPVAADGKEKEAITHALGLINTQTADLGSAVANWKGDLLGALPITTKSAQLLEQLRRSRRTADASRPLSTDEALAVAVATGDLSRVVQATLGTIVDNKPRFDKLLVLSPVVLLNLELQRGATADFSDAVVRKVPEGLKTIAQGLIKPIDDAFAAAIDKYKLFWS